MTNFRGIEVLGSHRADKAKSASCWSPRDLLLDLIRAIDAGETNPDELVVVYRHDGRSCWLRSGQDRHVAIGLIEEAKAKILIK